jgi:hypothetical protein
LREGALLGVVGFNFLLVLEDGEPNDPAVSVTAVPNWTVGEVIPFGQGASGCAHCRTGDSCELGPIHQLWSSDVWATTFIDDGAPASKRSGPAQDDQKTIDKTAPTIPTMSKLDTAKPDGPGHTLRAPTKANNRHSNVSGVGGRTAGVQPVDAIGGVPEAR